MSFSLDVRYRMPLLLAGFVSLAIGIGGGLLRLGWNFPLPSAGLAGLHGPLLVCGFLGTLISLERAVAIERRWAYAAPLCAGLGGLWLVAGGPWAIGAGLFVLTSAVLVAASLQVWRRLRALFTLTMLLGALGWLLGNLLWLSGMDIPRVVPWWVVFLVLTIAGERLELSRFLPRQPGSHATFGAIVAALLLGAALATLAPAAGVLLLSLSLFLLACWLLRHDIARRTFRQPGLTGYMGVCLLSGYVWLLVAALVGAYSPQLLPGASYDAFLHAILVGFVLSMIFAHAPVIFPAVTRIRIPYHAIFYLPLIVLHASLVARLAGDLLAIPHCRTAGGALNAVALLLFVLCAAGSVLHGKRQAASSSPYQNFTQPLKGNTMSTAHLHLLPEQIYPFDARGIAKRFRHAAIFGALDALNSGETMRFVNDHDPLPLLDQLTKRYGEAVTIQYLQREPGQIVIDFIRT